MGAGVDVEGGGVIGEAGTEGGGVGGGAGRIFQRERLW